MRVESGRARPAKNGVISFAHLRSVFATRLPQIKREHLVANWNAGSTLIHLEFLLFDFSPHCIWLVSFHPLTC